MDLENFKHYLKAALDGAVEPSAFAWHHRSTTSPNPALTINGIGRIGLPLSQREADMVVSKCRQSPFGRGGDTLVDTSVRNSWELDATEFSLENPAWVAFISDLVTMAHESLGLTCPRDDVRAEVYKLLLYEEGAFFKPHQDSEKTPGMFGTMAVCLPSKHEGGRIVLTHNGKQEIIDSATYSDFDVTSAAWYSDVFHEVEPVTTGNRFVVIYNLVQTDTRVLQCASDGQNKSTLSKLLQEYESAVASDRSGFPPFITDKLSHYYSQNALRTQALKGPDFRRIQLLQDVCKSLNFDVLLATFEKTTQGDDEYDVDELDYDTEENFKHVVDLEGNLLDFKFEYHEDCVLWDPRKEADGDADESEHEGYTGNEGAPVTFWYRETVFIIVPPSRKVDMYIDCNGDFTTALSAMDKLKTEAKTDKSKTQDLFRLCHVLSSKLELPKDYKSSYSRSWDTEWKRTRDKKVAQINRARDALITVALDFEQDMLFTEATKGCNLPRETLRDLVEACKTSGTSIWRGSLHNQVESAKTMAEKWSMLKTIDNLYRSSTTEAKDEQSFEVWFFEALRNSLQSVKTFCKADGTAVGEIVRRGLVNISREVIPKLGEFTAEAQGTFAIVLGENKETSKEPEVFQALQSTLDKFWSTFQRPDLIPVIDMDSQSLTGTELSDLLDVESGSGSYGLVRSLVALQEAAGRLRGELVLNNLVPLIERIVNQRLLAIQDSQEEGVAEAISYLVLRVLYFLVQNYIGAEPIKPQDWAKPYRGCGCRDCLVVDEYMADPNKQILEFPCSKQRRRHLEYKFQAVWPSVDRSFSVEVVAKGSPHIWRVTKNNGKYDVEHPQWLKRHETARQSMESIGGRGMTKLQPYLGQHFQSITMCRVETLPPKEELFRQPLHLASPNAAGSSSNNKRKADSDGVENESQHKPKRPATDSVGGVDHIDLTGT